MLAKAWHFCLHVRTPQRLFLVRRLDPKGVREPRRVDQVVEREVFRDADLKKVTW